MKRLLQPPVVIVATVALALVGWSTVSAAAVSRSAHRAELRQVAAEPSAEPQVENQAPAAAEPQQEQAPVENEAAENENEAAEAAENEPEDEDENENPAPPTPAQAPTPAPTASTSTRTFSLVGGTATFTCTGSTISLVSAVPASGFQMETETEDGGGEIEVKFESSAHKSEIKAECIGGQVQATELREEAS